MSTENVGKQHSSFTLPGVPDPEDKYIMLL